MEPAGTCSLHRLMVSPPYRQLESKKGETRILHILPAIFQSAEEVHCELVYYCLAIIRNMKALFYTWGTLEPEIGSCIRLNSQRFQVYENLFAAFLRLRSRLNPRLIWIDGVCTNHDNFHEQEQQILLMRQIYEQAQRILVWLVEPILGKGLAMLSLIKSRT